MSNLVEASNIPRVVFFGMPGRFSYASLYALLNSGIQVCAVVIPSRQDSEVKLPAIQKQETHSFPRSILPVLNFSMRSSILDLAQERDIPVWKVRQLSNLETLRMLKVYQPDVICVACFSIRIPRDVLNVPRLGCLNVHPSLLPANRGPEPLFWTFREGSDRTGVTIHIMDENLDSGAIVAQEAFEIPDGIKYSELEAVAADVGGKLLTQSVRNMYNGIAILVKQDETKSSYHPFPCDNDFVVPVAVWNAKHVYNFVCGVDSMGIPIYLLIEGKTIHINKAISYSLKTIETNHSIANKLSDKECWIRCKQGSVLVEKK